MYKPGSKISNADGFSRLPIEDYVTSLPVPEEVVLSRSTLHLTPVTSKPIAFYTSRDPVLSQVRKWILHGWPENISWLSTIHNQERWVIGNNWLCFIGITSGYPSKVSRCFTERIAWESSRNFSDEVSWLVVTFGGLRWIQILNCVRGVVGICQDSANMPQARALHPCFQVHMDYAGPIQAIWF